MSQPDERPLLRVVKGEPTPEELAALVAVVAARASASLVPPAGQRQTPWAAPERRLRRSLAPASGAWRASAWPG